MLRATEVRARVAALAGLLVLLLSSGCNGGAEQGKTPSTPAASPTAATTTTPVAREFTAIPLNGTYEGSTTANAEGAFTFEKALSGPFATATTTDAGGNTSPFSSPFPVPAS
jgi:hypothetical protein